MSYIHPHKTPPYIYMENPLLDIVRYKKHIPNGNRRIEMERNH